jgi:transcriptional regulator with XRE-family HTH domain
VSKSPDPVDLHVGARLRYRRMLLGMSQEALAGRLGLTFQQIQKYEKGQNRVGASRLWRLAQALDAPVGYFFEDLPDAPAEGASRDPRPLDFVSSPEGLDLNLAFERIGDGATRRKVVDLVRALAGERGA